MTRGRRLRPGMRGAAFIVLLMLVLSGATAPPAAPRSDRVGDHVDALRARLPRGFTIVVEPPFVVIGDGPAETVEAHARDIVAWAVRRLTLQYFDTPPRSVIDIYLFKDARSYRSHARSLFGETPSTPYGYYSPRHQALIMDISTGGGTLVHEMVHPYMHAHFPACPPWFNEGLASLYEACEERDGRMVGLVNWRLEQLQAAIRRKATIPLARLLGMNDRQFYEDRGLNYAMARYLCYALQQRGQLETFYRRFRAAHATDPTGEKTLREVLGEDDLAVFQEGWERDCLALTPP